MLYDKRMVSLKDKILEESLEPEPKEEKKKEEKVVTSTKKKGKK